MVVKIFKLFLILSISLNAGFKKDCAECHIKKDVDLRKTFMNALLVYGGENNFKTALFYYCKNPTPMSSVMSEEFIKKFTPLKPTMLSEEKLHLLIDEYWKKYKIQGNLK